MNQPASNGSTLIQIADAALADAYRRAGGWMACKPGCTPCCIGVFPISPLDAERLRAGLRTAPEDVAERILSRAAASRARLAQNFPGDAATGQLFTEDGHEEAFADFANDEPCPVLDPQTGTCDLYASRPMPCRTFGPPMPNEEGGLAVCELCFVGAPASEVERCRVDAGFLDLEAEADALHQTGNGMRGQTLIAFALVDTVNSCQVPSAIMDA